MGIFISSLEPLKKRNKGAEMNPQELAKMAVEAASEKSRMTLVLPRPWKDRPKGFPRGLLLQERGNTNVYSFDPKKILLWMAKNNLISVNGKP